MTRTCLPPGCHAARARARARVCAPSMGSFGRFRTTAFLMGSQDRPGRGAGVTTWVDTDTVTVATVQSIHGCWAPPSACPIFSLPLPLATFLVPVFSLFPPLLFATFPGFLSFFFPSIKLNMHQHYPRCLPTVCVSCIETCLINVQPSRTFEEFKRY